MVVDDIDMGIDTVIRGADHHPNTPLQIALYRALDAEPPTFAHVPLIVNPAGKKLSKRREDVAIEHWARAAPPEVRASTAWVVVRHEIDYLKPAMPGDEVVARTWVEKWGGSTSERHTELLRRADDVALARGRTVWCALDAGTRRLKRVTPEMSEPFHDP